MEKLPQYYFQDLPAEIMSEIVKEMESIYPEPTWEEVDAWINALMSPRRSPVGTKRRNN